MLTIARGLVSDPAIMLIDEPTEGLMPSMVEQISRILEEMNRDGVTILLVEQNVHLAFALSEQAYVIAEGRLFTEGPPAELASRPEIRQAYLGL